MQTMEAGSWWRSQVVCRGTHASRNNVRLSQPGAPRTQWKQERLVKTSKAKSTNKEEVKKDYHSVGRGAQDTMTQGPQLIFSMKKLREPCLPRVYHPGEYLGGDGGNLRGWMCFPLVISVQGPEISLQRLWNRSDKLQTWLDIPPELFFIALMSG